MRQKSNRRLTSPSERLVKNIRASDAQAVFGRKQIRIVLTACVGESSIAELCRREGIGRGVFITGWSKEFLVGRQAPAGGRHGACGHEQRGDGPAP